MGTERITQVINEVVSLELDLTVENVYTQSLFSPGGTLFNCDEEVKECIVLHIIGLMKARKVFVNIANVRTQLDFIKLEVSDEFISKCMRVEYLGRPLVDGIEYEITDNKIKIVCPHTSYINITRHEKISLDSILSMLNEIDKIRKADKRIKVKGISTIRKRVKDAYKLYLIDWEVYNEAFNKCMSLAKQVEREGVHYGTIDDAVLEEIIKTRFVIDRLGYGGTNYSTMLGLNNSVKGALNACRAIDIDCLKMEAGL